jgi:glycosyltransferase involved in cell wall biosynthesis
MKVLLVAPQPFFQERGTPIAVRLVAETLCAYGHQVDLLVYHEGEEVHVPGLRLIRAGRPPGVRKVPIGISWQKIMCDLWLIPRLIGAMLRNRYDVVHAVEEAIFPAAILNLFTRRKLIYDMDSSLVDQLTDKWRPLRPIRNLLRLVERAAVSQSHIVFAVCEDLAEKVRPWIGNERVVVLPDVPMNGQHHSAEQIEDLRSLVGTDAILTLYVGNLERYQGVDLLLEGLKASRAENVRLVVIGGEPAHISRYQAQAQAMGIADQVRFIGRRPLVALADYLEQADVLVSPRVRGQNTPMKVYSYMQAGKAILATDIRSHVQALDPTCAELVPATPEAVGRGLERLAGDAQLRRQLGEGARRRVERDFSPAAFRRRLQDGYGRLFAVWLGFLNMFDAALCIVGI